jgi:ribosome-associated heat shock protein Hsp15
MDADPAIQTDVVRLDIWLWRARFFRTRSLSAAHIRIHGVRLTHAGETRRVDKPAHTVTGGDVVTFARGPHIVSCRVLAVGERRGPASEASHLYQSLDMNP